MMIVAHPWLALLIAGTPLVLLAWQAKHLDTSIPSGDWLPKSAESVQALHTLEKMDRTGIVYSMRVVIELPNEFGHANRCRVGRAESRGEAD